MQRSVKKGLSARELAAWRGFLRVHSALVRELDDELEAEQGLPLTSYEVLVLLDEAPQGRLRMSELAGSLLLSQSGVTRLVDRLARARLVRRERCETDGRGTFALLLPEGRRRLHEARPTHHAGIRRLFLERLSPREQSHLAELWGRMLPDEPT
jgi:DNA-binding MarR family transcriptional regulator